MSDITYGGYGSATQRIPRYNSNYLKFRYEYFLIIFTNGNDQLTSSNFELIGYRFFSHEILFNLGNNKQKNT